MRKDVCVSKDVKESLSLEALPVKQKQLLKILPKILNYF